MPRSTFDKNLEQRLKETIDSELEPEFVTPMTAGAEELPEYQGVFPLTRQMNQTNMRNTGRRPRSQQGRGKDLD